MYWRTYSELVRMMLVLHGIKMSFLIYHSNIHMTPFEALHEIRCRSNQFVLDEIDPLDTDFFRNVMEQVHMIYG